MQLSATLCSKKYFSPKIDWFLYFRYLRSCPRTNCRTLTRWVEAKQGEFVFPKNCFNSFNLFTGLRRVTHVTNAVSGYTSRHLHQRIDEHRFSAIGKHLKNDHGLYNIDDLANNFSVLKKCNGKLDCLIYEMLFIRKKKPSLNTQSDSIRAKLFV